MRDTNINSEAIKQASGILQRILDEEPAFWPYGLSIDQFDGGLYLLSKQANSADYIGFVGWQEREEEGKRIGYYAIGVLPEHRRQGMAKAAVQKLLMQKAAGVDEVRALVMTSNTPSQQLARTIPGVNLTLVEKLASFHKSAASRQALSALAGALGSAAFYDQTANPDRTIGDTAQFWKWDKQRALQGAVNAALGALGGQQLASVKGAITPGEKGVHFASGLGALLSPVAKDLMLKGQQSLHKSDDMMAALTAASKRESKSIGDVISKPMLYGALGLGASGLGLAAYSALQKARAAKAQAEAARGGRVRVTLPTKDPNDAETFLDMPLEEINLSSALKQRLGRDTRRRLLEETRKRTKRRKPSNPNAPTERELEDMQLAQEEAALDKAAAAAAPAVPSPPGPGNPALRMTQQAAAAKSIDTSTQANPQIMKAQQDAATASMDAQNQVAQSQQQTQQQLMDQQNQFQSELQKADAAKQQVIQENQILQMKLEKAQVEADLLQAKYKAKDEISQAKNDSSNSDGDSARSQLSKLIESRLNRVRNAVTKNAAKGDPWELDPNTGHKGQGHRLDPNTGEAPLRSRDSGSSYGASPQTGLVSPWGIEVDTKRKPARSWELDAVTGLKAQSGELDPNTGAPVPSPIKLLRHDAAQQLNDYGNEYMAQGGAPNIHLFRASYGKIGDALYDYLLKPYLNKLPDRPGQELGMLGNLSLYGQQFLRQPRF
jgi:GNAT superfamily N-acetyltransferase